MGVKEFFEHPFLLNWMNRFGYASLLGIVLGLLILGAPFVLRTSPWLKWVELVFGGIILIMGLYFFSIRHRLVLGEPAKVAK